MVAAGRTTTKDLSLEDEQSDVGLSGVVLEPGGTPSAAATVRVAGSGGGATHGHGLAHRRSGKFQIAGARSSLPSTLEVMASNGGRSARATVGPSRRRSFLPQGPAEVAGGRLGDLVAAIDGLATHSATEASARLKGAPGTPVSLALRRAGNALSITATRAL